MITRRQMLSCLAAAVPAGAAMALDTPAGPVVLTVRGRVRMPNQGDKAQFDMAMLERLAQQPGHVGWHLDTVGKSELLKRVVLEGPLPRKTFSMGEAHEKRFYIEARRIR